MSKNELFSFFQKKEVVSTELNKADLSTQKNSKLVDEAKKISEEIPDKSKLTAHHDHNAHYAYQKYDRYNKHYIMHIDFGEEGVGLNNAPKP